jgi:hypothetical protein
VSADVCNSLLGLGFSRGGWLHRKLEYRRFLTLKQKGEKDNLPVWDAPAMIGWAKEPWLGGCRRGTDASRGFDIVYRYADGSAERLPALAEDLVRLKPNVILASARTRRRGPSGPGGQQGAAEGECDRDQPYVAGLPAKQMELAREVVPELKDD